MILYIKVSFWLLIFGNVVRFLLLTFAKYPRNVEYKRWEDALSILISGGFIFWAAALIFK